jgi:F-type H+-transporting ATPase subunit b
MESGGLIGQLGIDWKLFLSQAFNFFILLVILRVFAYKPLLAIIKERNKRIIEGLEKAKQADVRLKEVDVIAKEKIKIAEQESISIIKNTEEKAKILEQSLQKKSEEKQKELMHQVQLSYQKQQEESKKIVLQEAAALVKKFIVKTVELKPEAIDDMLLKKAISEIKKVEP